MQPGVATGAEAVAGPYRASVERVVDGDTLAVRVTVWLGQEVRVLVRLRGIDAPELRGGCASERSRAVEAREALHRLVADAALVLTAIEGDKYFGRVVADVTTQAGDNLGAALLAGGHARVYDGSARGPWCGAAAQDAGQADSVAAIDEGDRF